MAKDNAHYGVESRVFVTNVSKARDLDRELLEKIDDQHIRISLELQKALGLRREEAIKFIPEHADQGNHIRLKATWCKGGRERTIPIRNDEQRDVLKRARLLAERGSLIPSHLMYVQQMCIYERETAKAGLYKLHGLRHRYGPIRYEDLTGWPAPACGGPSRDVLSEDQRLDDSIARLAITQELGHGREQVTAVYLGRERWCYRGSRSTGAALAAGPSRPRWEQGLQPSCNPARKGERRYRIKDYSLAPATL